MKKSAIERRVNSPKQDWKSDSYLGYKPHVLDWARLAAYIDGEGSINLTPRRTDTGGTLTLCGKVVVTNTDPRLAKWCLETFGMKFYSHSNNKLRNPNWRGCYFAQACGYKAAWILRNCLPHFILKAARAEIVLEHQESTKAGTFQRGSGIRTPQNILDYRLNLKQRLSELNRRGPGKPESTVEKLAMEA